MSYTKGPWEMTKAEYMENPSYKVTTWNAAGEVTGLGNQQVIIVSSIADAQSIIEKEKDKRRYSKIEEIPKTGKEDHRQIVSDAIKAHKPVPSVVIAEYPTMGPSGDNK